MKICCVCAARPNFVKMDALLRAMRRHPRIASVLVHTGQHYDDQLSRALFEDLGIPAPDIQLAVGSASHATQTARIMERFEAVVEAQRPEVVLVVGDVNSTLACSLVAIKMGVKVAHVEAGLRSFDRSMPEEINRIVTDAISDFLFVSEPSGLVNLAAEGVSSERVFFSGNVMIDTLLRCRTLISKSTVLDRLTLTEKAYGLLTLHRPGNVDDRKPLTHIIEAVAAIGERLPIVFPAHPRTRDRMKLWGLDDRLAMAGGVRLIEPLGYLDFARLMDGSRLVLTDSGGVQEETTILGIPCLTLRDNTERPITLERGTNRLVGTDTAAIVAEAEQTLASPPPSIESPPEGWDGHAADRVVEVLLRRAT